MRCAADVLQRVRETIMMRLVNFKTEYQSCPLAVETKTPRFSWQYADGFTGTQVSYRIFVASKPSLLQEGKADLWDSGTVRSSSCVGIAYAGAPLRSHSRYYVLCTARDAEGKEYGSEISSFETALFDAADWKGGWVSVPNNFNGGTLLFRKLIRTDESKKIVRARAYVCGLGYHEFFVNGKKIGQSVLNPGISEYSERVLYCVYPMDELRGGDNVVGVEVGYGWFGGRKLLVQIYIEYEDGTVLEDHSGPGNGWWVGGSPTVENSIYGGEVYDARLEDVYPRNWNTLGFCPTWANGWMYTISTPAPRGKLEAQQIEPIEVCARYPERSRTDKGGGVWLIDVGQNMAGWLRIRVQGERGASVTLKFGEQLTQEGYVNRINLRSARCTDTYILRGEGVEEYAPRFTYHGFRYVQAEISGKAELLSCVGEHVHTATRVVGDFSCSDEQLCRLHRIALVTELNNEHSVLTDCPQRDERFGWLNDLGSRIYQTVYNIDLARFIPKFIRDITHTQQPDGGIADTAPYYTGGVPADPVCVIYPLLANYAFRYYGDRRTAEEEYLGIRRWVEFLLSRSHGYIMDYSYYADWVPPFADVKTDELYVSTLYLLWHLREMCRLAQITGHAEDEKRYVEHLQKCANAVHKKYFDREKCVYCGGTQSENALALSLGVVPQEFRARVAENIFRDAVARNHHCTGGNIGYRHIFYVLAEYGYTDEVLRILKNPEYPGWGYMLEKDATTVWERWEAEMQNEMHSFDHPMFGSYDAFFYRFLGGISVDEDAFACDKIGIEPVFTKLLDRVDCAMDTVRGKIVSRWKRGQGGIEIHVEVPPQTSARFRAGGISRTLSAGSYDFLLQE